MPVRPPSLRAVAAFEAAARHRSFARAAEELNLTPGAISHAIKGLEERLQQTLFDRVGKHVVLTPSGQRLAARVRLSLGLLADAFDVAPWHMRGRLVVSTLSPIAERILLPAFGQLTKACSGVVFDLRCSPALADLDGDVDVAIRFGPGKWQGLESRFLGEERLFPVASPAYAGGALPRTEEELPSQALIHHPESNWRLWSEDLTPSSVEGSLFIDEAAVVLKAAAAGQGIALARGRLVQNDIEAGTLVRLFDRSVAAEYSYWAVWSPSSPKLAMIDEFVRAASELFVKDIG